MRPEKLPNVRKTATGYVAAAVIGRGPGKRQDKRFPADADAETIKAWQEATRTALRTAAPTRTPGTFADDVERIYLPIKKATMPAVGYRQRDQHMAMWIAELGGDRSRLDIKPVDIIAARARYMLAGGGREKPTANRARTALMDFYNTVGGKSGYNPVRDVKKFKERRKPAPEITFDLYDRIMGHLADRGATTAIVNGRRVGCKVAPVSKTKLRLAVIAFTALPHEIVKQIRPTDIDWQGRRVYIQGRDKGEGTDPRWHPVSNHGMAALRAFADGGAFGRFSTSSMLANFTEAVAKVKAESPDLFLGETAITPNKLRHLCGSTLTVLAGRSVASDLMIHTSEETTKIYTEAAEEPVRRAALDAFDAYLDARPKAPTPPPPPAAPPVWTGPARNEFAIYLNARKARKGGQKPAAVVSVGCVSKTTKRAKRA